MTNPDSVYQNQLETPPALWANCDHCGRKATKFCPRCGPLGSHWCNDCLKSYHGYWKQSGKSTVFVSTKWTQVFHKEDERRARKTEKAAFEHNKKLAKRIRRIFRPAEFTFKEELERLERCQLPVIRETTAIATTQRSAKKRTRPAATATSAVGATSPATDSASATSVVTSVLIVRPGMTRLLSGYTVDQEQSSRPRLSPTKRL
jgi:hypothetical protein